MPLTLDRRLLIQGSLLGLGALTLPGMARAMTAQGFTHGVASGEPSGNSVLLWTRYVGSGETKLRCEVAADEAFTKVILAAVEAAGADLVLLSNTPPGWDVAPRIAANLDYRWSKDFLEAGKKQLAGDTGA